MSNAKQVLKKVKAASKIHESSSVSNGLNVLYQKLHQVTGDVVAMEKAADKLNKMFANKDPDNNNQFSITLMDIKGDIPLTIKTLNEITGLINGIVENEHQRQVKLGK